jgi:acetyltransferase-like isoleucine patch superfamily enzyme
MDYFDDETPELRATRSQILRYRTADLMNDRERAAFFGLPQGCRMRENAKIISPDQLKCGKNVWIGEGAVLDASGGLEIGDNSQIGLGVMLWSHSSHRQALKGETGTSRAEVVRRATRIGSNCFIAGPSAVGPGVTIGDGVIVSPLSFVDRDLPDGAVYSNNKERARLESRVDKLEQDLAELLSTRERG